MRISRSSVTEELSYRVERNFHVRWGVMKNTFSPEEIDPVWLLPEKVGRDNYTKWLHAQYLKLPPRVGSNSYCLVRRDDSLPWGPDNCQLLSLKEHFETLPSRGRLGDAVRNDIVNYARENPTVILREIAKLFGCGTTTVSGILREARMPRNKKTGGLL